jgi:hypothetical protein
MTRLPALSDPLSARLVAIEARLAALEALQPRSEPAQTPELTVRIETACKRMGWRYSWAVRHWRELGGYKDLDGRLKIRLAVLERLARG